MKETSASQVSWIQSDAGTSTAELWISAMATVRQKKGLLGNSLRYAHNLHDLDEGFNYPPS